MASKMMAPKLRMGMSRPFTVPRAIQRPTTRTNLSKPLQGVCSTSYSTATTSSTQDSLREYFAVVWNKPNAVVTPEDAANLKFADDQVQITFSGEMVTPSETTQTGICFACQAPSEERVKSAILAHEKNLKGIWDMDKVEVSALETVHTSDFQK